MRIGDRVQFTVIVKVLEGLKHRYPGLVMGEPWEDPSNPDKWWVTVKFDGVISEPRDYVAGCELLVECDDLEVIELVNSGV